MNFSFFLVRVHCLLLTPPWLGETVTVCRIELDNKLYLSRLCLQIKFQLLNSLEKHSNGPSTSVLPLTRSVNYYTFSNWNRKWNVISHFFFVHVHCFLFTHTLLSERGTVCRTELDNKLYVSQLFLPIKFQSLNFLEERSNGCLISVLPPILNLDIEEVRVTVWSPIAVQYEM